MKFSAGQYVRFINSTDEGVITKVISSEVVVVDIEDGLGIEVPVRELVVVDTKPNKLDQPVKQKQGIDKVPEKVVQEEEQLSVRPEVTQIKDAGQIKLCFEKSYDGIKIYLLNAQHLAVHVFLFSKIQGNYELFSQKDVSGCDCEYLGETDLVENSGMLIDIVWLEHDTKHKKAPLSQPIKIKKSRFFKEDAFQYLPEIGRFVIQETVHEEDDFSKSIDISKLREFKRETEQGVKVSKKHNRNGQLEIDVHIEELLDNHRNMSNGEILDIQLKAVQKKIDEAIRAHIREVVVIHGVGKGVLRQEVRNLVKSLNYQYSDASYSKYGAGATLIELW